jgi:hypothetical protein
MTRVLDFDPMLDLRAELHEISDTETQVLTWLSGFTEPCEIVVHAIPVDIKPIPKRDA